ncbi:glycosyltransferase [Terrisporobacter sp.]|uniref:glycosyltransferase n=1 Tax=Terrisporobacter sp. TaxID=1965305 RepID=UPI00261B5156|nr:glycosyltransferase [Terrisporobacter sp.]
MNAKIGYPYIAFNIFMMVAAGSKTAFIVLGFILLYQFILFIKEKSKITKVIIVGITLVGILFTIICFGDRLANLRIFDINYGLAENQINSFTWRILKWKSNMEVWYKNILGVIFGYGYRSEQFYGMEGYSMHNEYLRIIFNTGIIGTILLLNFSISFINKVTRIEDKDKKIFYISVLILIIIGSVSENLFVASETTVMYLAILFSINSNEFKNKLMKREYKHINVSPLVSVVMSTYNESSNDLDLSIQSILQQSYKNIEFIIVLDNPQNKIIKNVLNRYKELDERIVIIENEKNIGLVKSLNKALKVASGKYIARMDADDISYRDRILKQVNILESYNEISLVGTDILLIDEENIEIKNENLLISDPVQLKKCIGLCNCIAHPTWMFRKSILDDLKEYNEIPCAEDYDFLIRMAICGYEFYNIDEKLLKYRIRQNSITQSSEYKQLIMTTRIRKAYKKSRGSVSNYNKHIDTNVDCNIHIKSKELYYKIKNKEGSNILSKLVSKFVALCNPYFRSHLISRMIIRTKVYKLL